VLVAVATAGCAAAGGAATTVAPSTSSTVASTTATAAPTQPPATTTTVTTTAPATTTSDSGIHLGPAPDYTGEIVSPAWLPEDWEDMGELIEIVTDGEPVSVSNLMSAAVLDNLDRDALPYYYVAATAGDLVVTETLGAQLPEKDTVAVTWLYEWENTPPCHTCEKNQVRWDNGWDVWTDPEPERGIIVFYANHPDLPLRARAAFGPDPVEWPEADPGDHPVLRTSQPDAATICSAILDSLAETIPIPEL
jgi:hypothetical protein